MFQRSLPKLVEGFINEFFKVIFPIFLLELLQVLFLRLLEIPLETLPKDCLVFFFNEFLGFLLRFFPDLFLKLFLEFIQEFFPESLQISFRNSSRDSFINISGYSFWTFLNSRQWSSGTFRDSSSVFSQIFFKDFHWIFPVISPGVVLWNISGVSPDYFLSFQNNSSMFFFRILLEVSLEILRKISLGTFPEIPPSLLYEISSRIRPTIYSRNPHRLHISQDSSRDFKKYTTKDPFRNIFNDFSLIFSGSLA